MTKEEILNSRMNQPDTWKGLDFVIDGDDIHDGRKSYTINVRNMIMLMRRLPFKVIINNITKASPLVQAIYDGE